MPRSLTTEHFPIPVKVENHSDRPVPVEVKNRILSVEIQRTVDTREYFGDFDNGAFNNRCVRGIGGDNKTHIVEFIFALANCDGAMLRIKYPSKDSATPATLRTFEPSIPLEKNKPFIQNVNFIVEKTIGEVTFEIDGIYPSGEQEGKKCELFISGCTVKG